MCNDRDVVGKKKQNQDIPTKSKDDTLITEERAKLERQRQHFQEVLRLLLDTSGQEKTREAKRNMEKINGKRVERGRSNVPTGRGYSQRQDEVALTC